MSRLRIFVLALSLAALACNRDSAPKSPKLADVMPNVPLPPGATFISRSGGADAIQITVRSPAGADAVAAYYRGIFKKGGWRLVNDAKDREGAVVLFAEQHGPPLWVRIKGEEGGTGTVVDLAGARLIRQPESKPDTSKPPAPPPARTTS
ncbi:MAG: hypothetical protein ABI766_07845 [Gemmatimonadales bacterium]